MKTRITESTLLFISIAKWVFLATISGAIVGFTATIFIKLLNISTAAVGAWKHYYLLLPLALLVSSLLVKYFAPDAKGHGTEKVIEAIHKNAARISPLVVPVKLVATLVTIAFGGSAGKEGPCAQIGSGLTSALSDLLHFSEHDRKKLVICGISAGFAAVFGTPIAGSIFGVEVLFVGAILYEVLLPSFIAGITAYQVSAAMKTSYFYKPVDFIPVFSETFMLKVVLAGIFFGLVSLILIELLKYGEKAAERVNIRPPLNGLVGGVGLILLALLVSNKYLGLGLETIEAQLSGAPAVWYDFPLKAIFTSITLAFGGSGGIVTPIFFIGTSAGSLYAQMMHLDYATFAAIGFVAVLSGAANTPIAASIMAVELFGPVIAPYATVVCVISFLMTGHRSVYPSQVLSIRKTDSIQVELGKELGVIKTSGYHTKPKSAAALALRIIQKVDYMVTRRN